MSATIECALDHDANSCLTDFGDGHTINAIHGWADLSASTQISTQMECVTGTAVFDPVIIEYGPYGDGDDYIDCLRINVNGDVDGIADSNRELWLRDYEVDDLRIRSLRVEFEMLSMNLERGFDNVFLSWQYNDVYSRHYVSWTGDELEYQANPGMDTRGRSVHWNVLTGDHLEICLNLQSDEDVVGDGFKGMFSIVECLLYMYFMEGDMVKIDNSNTV